MNIENLVYVEAEDRFSKLSGMDPTTDEGKATTNLVFGLVDRAVKMADSNTQAKLAELKEKELNLQAEANTLKAMELEEAKKQRWVDFGRDCIKVTVPGLIALGGAVLLTVYEHSEVVTDTGPKKFWDKLLRMG